MDFLKPQFILISAGFDCHFSDPLGSMKVFDTGFYEMSKIVIEWSEKYTNGKIISVLEGWYSISHLHFPVSAHILGLIKRNES
ncbi:MAG: hypothetical protein ACUVUG_02195 [Candidatus Aminicenantia bacterium]